MLVMFLDESGDHQMEKIDPQYPVITLAGCILDEEYHENLVDPAMRRLKRRVFGTDEIIFHDADIKRNRNGFEDLSIPWFRDGFFEEVNRFITDTDFKIVAASLKKLDHKAKYSNPEHPYHYCLLISCIQQCRPERGRG